MNDREKLVQYAPGVIMDAFERESQRTGTSVRALVSDVLFKEAARILVEENSNALRGTR